MLPAKDIILIIGTTLSSAGAGILTATSGPGGITATGLIGVGASVAVAVGALVTRLGSGEPTDSGHQGDKEAPQS